MSRVRLLTVTAMCSATICIMSMISINLGFIAFSLSMLAVVLTGLILPPLYATSACLIYVVLGAVGLPVFAGLAGGLGVLFSKSGGFIFSYPLVALIVSVFIKIYGYKKATIILSMVISILVCYIFGVSWFMFVTGLDAFTSIIYCVLPFVAIDAIKCFLAYSITSKIKKYIIKT